MTKYMDLKTSLTKETIVKQLLDLKPSAIRMFSLESCTEFCAKIKNETIHVYCERKGGFNDFVSIEDEILDDDLWKDVYRKNLIYTA